MKKLFALSVLVISLIGIFGISPITAEAAATSCYNFTRNLTLGSSGADVQALQQFLNSQNILVATTGVGSRGKETTYFGSKTQVALAKFQVNTKIVPAAGYFGPLTRAAIKNVCLNSATESSTLGTGSANSVAVKDPEVIPVAPPLPVVVTPPPVTAPPAVINPASIVGVLCFYDYRGRTQLMKGTGVIVNPDGYILTARHILDPQWTRQAYDATLDAAQKDLYENAVLRHCEIGIPENISVLPTPEEIRATDPSTLITRNFQYSVQTYYLPPKNGLSDQEYNTADLAVLKVIAPTPICPFTSQICNLVNNFPYTPISTQLPAVGTDEILSYGYPVETSINEIGNQFYDFYFKGAVGTIGRYVGGDQHFIGQPLSFSFEAQDIENGRSGSPLFSKGKVVGILFGSTVGTNQESYNLSVYAIATLLHEANLDSVLRTQ